jgi:HD-GYP domain-containing protein (c-di-GMP phosphodiesterase class II)
MSINRQNKEHLEIAGTDAHNLVNLFFVLFRTARVYEANNQAYLKQSAKFYEVFRRRIDITGELTIKIVDGRLMVDDRLVQFDSDNLTSITYVIDGWHLLGIGGVTMNTSLDNRQLDKFVYFISKLSVTSGGHHDIIKRLKDMGITGITLHGVETKQDTPDIPEDEKKQLRRKARVTFFRAVSAVEDVMSNTRETPAADLSQARRVVHSLIDQLAFDESYLLQLTALRDFDEYTYVHSTNISIYSLTMGVKLGLDRKRLSQLGFAALFHDLGKIKLPGDLIRKPDVYDENDWIQMQKHPELGAKTVLRNLQYNQHSVRAALAAFEHHINNDYTGYPVLVDRRSTNLFSKIVSITDTFDALASGRVYIKRSVPHDEILYKMMHQMTKKFDTFLLKLFINIIGMYPVGSLVILSNDELAIVSKNDQNHLARPRVRIIGNKSGPFSEFADVDLASPENSDRSIVRIIDPQKYNINLKKIILSED